MRSIELGDCGARLRGCADTPCATAGGDSERHSRGSIELDSKDDGRVKQWEVRDWEAMAASMPIGRSHALE
jgi:hypothetical protein